MSAEEINQQLLEALKGLGASFNDSHYNTRILTELKAVIRESKPTGGHANKPPTFRGDSHDDIEEFIQQFTRYADFYNWSAERRLRALPLNFVGPASTWYNTISTSVSDYSNLLERLRAQFNSNAWKWVLRQQLTNRRQAPNESVSEYGNDIRRLCQRLALQQTDWLHYFVLGLRPDIQSHVILAQPTTLGQAENLAKLKETTLQKPASPANSADDLTKAILAHLQPTAISNPLTTAPVATFEVQRENHQSHMTGHEIKRLVQMEIRNALRDFVPNNPASLNRRFNDENNYFRGGPSNFSPRNRRTPQGVPICNNCGRRGHTAYNFYSRDPRIPRATRTQSPSNSHPRLPQGN